MIETLDLTNACITCSFQAEDVVVVHLAIQHKPDIPVLFLETGYHFPETVAYRDQISAKQSVADQEAQFGILNQTAPDRCCGFRKVTPLFEGLAPYETWITGLRREQSPTRANLQIVEQFKLPSGKELKKVSPLAMWTNREVWKYLDLHDIPVLPLYEKGYTSIGCAPCTELPFDPENARSGRWHGKKLECGIHIQAE
jgi:phosphoadenosine phosphosulfate reductase